MKKLPGYLGVFLLGMLFYPAYEAWHYAGTTTVPIWLSTYHEGDSPFECEFLQMVMDESPTDEDADNTLYFPRYWNAPTGCPKCLDGSGR